MKKKNAVRDNYIFLLLGLLILILAVFSITKFSTLWSLSTLEVHVHAVS